MARWQALGTIIGLNRSGLPWGWAQPPQPPAQGPGAPFKLRVEPPGPALAPLQSLTRWLWPRPSGRPRTEAVGILSPGWVDPLGLWPGLRPRLPLNAQPQPSQTAPGPGSPLAAPGTTEGPLADRAPASSPCSDPVGPARTPLLLGSPLAASLSPLSVPAARTWR